MKNLATAILSVMKEVKGIDKTMTVGTGSGSYKGVPDQEVKKIIGEAMQKNGLCLLPIGIEAQTKVERWEEETFYNGKSNGMKQKQSVFTEAKTKYLLLHESGESMEISGYGHGVDSQDKGAGKATTYALKYALLYTFLVPTGKIDDSDNDHSEYKEIPQKKAPVKKTELLPGTENWKGAVKYLVDGGTIEKIESKYFIAPANRESLLSEVMNEPVK
jgi:hypothetical protein